MNQAIKKFQSKAEDMFLSCMVQLAQLTNSNKLSNWIAVYTQKRMQQLQSDITKLRWIEVNLNDKLSKIHQAE